MPDDRFDELLTGLDGPRRIPPALRERLEHELVAEGNARPLPPELSRRLTEHLSPRRRRWDPSGWLKIAAALVVAAGVATALTVHPGGHAKPAPTASKAAPLTTQPGASAGVNGSQKTSLNPTASKAASPTITPAARPATSAGSASSARPANAEAPSAATVTAVAPNSGPAAGGTVVTITGSDLSGASAVSFGPSPAQSFEIVSGTEIRAVSPAHSPGTVYVLVTTPHGSTAPSATFRYLG